MVKAEERTQGMAIDELSLDSDLIERYLALLGLEREEPDLRALQRLVRAHLERVPFENISKLYYMKRFGLRDLPGIERFLNGIATHHFGGTCYANNYYFNRLLTALGYDVRLCGADMAHPDVHVVNMVRVGGGEFLVDGGYAAPLLTPLSREASEDQLIELGRDRYILKVQDERGNSTMELYRDGLFKHAYTAKPAARHIGEFTPVIASSFRPESTFMNALLITRFNSGGSLVLHNQTIIESRGRQSHVRALASRAELLEAIEELFGIPKEIAEEATSGLNELTDAWG